MSDPESQRLHGIVQGLRDDSSFLAGWLPKEPDCAEILRERLGIAAGDWARLLVCRPPRPSRFSQDVRQIAAYVSADPDSLAGGLREAAALGALRQTFGPAATVSDSALTALLTDAESLVAARDAAAEPLPIERAPRARIEELAKKFWDDAGRAGAERDLERATSVSLPLAVTLLPKLGLSSVGGWLNSYGINYDPGTADRALRGLLIATRGLGMVFLDGSLPQADRRFTLAHEVGHFVMDYLEARRRVLKDMPAMLGVLDGERQPTRAERAQATLAKLPIGAYTHLIDRDDQGGASSEIEDAEDEATLFAMELLAPWDDSLAAVQEATSAISGFDEALGAAANALATRFDLPRDVARARARACLDAGGRDRGLFDR